MCQVDYSKFIYISGQKWVRRQDFLAIIQRTNKVIFSQNHQTGSNHTLFQNTIFFLTMSYNKILSQIILAYTLKETSLIWTLWPLVLSAPCLPKLCPIIKVMTISLFITMKETHKHQELSYQTVNELSTE